MMRGRGKALCAVLLAGLGACSAAPRRGPPAADLEENAFRNAVRSLADDEYEGRRPGTPGADKTVEYIVTQFHRIGLKPVAGDSYLQQVPLTEITPDASASLGVSGRGVDKVLQYTKDMVIWTEREVTDAALHGSELVFVGYGIVAPEFAWNDYAGIDVHGKTVLVMVGDPGHATKDPKIFRGNAQTYYGLWNYKVAEAARHGAAGVLLIHDTGSAGYPWAAVVNSSTGPQFELASAAGGAGRAAIEGWLSLAATRAVFTQAGLDLQSLSEAAARAGFKATSLGLTVDAAVHNTLRRIDSPNVVGVIPGRDRSRECVIYTSHWDGLGRQAAAAGEAILPGAIDDASGVAGLLSLAQSFSRTRPAADRSIVFIAFTGTEAGLLGSAYYASHPLFPLRTTVAALNLDLLHIGGPTRDVMIYGYGNSDLEDYYREAALLQGREVHGDADPELGLYYRLDPFSFARSGVPALDAGAGLDDSARGPAWGQQHYLDYFANRYRQSTDKYSADWDVRGTLDDLHLYYEVGLRLAHSRVFPRFLPDSEFRSTKPPWRDATAVDTQ
jgi:Zn-dependent M28 family amino/carboxypeptidase